MAFLTAWDGTIFDIDALGEAQAYADLTAYVALHPQPLPPPPPPPPAPGRDDVLALGYVDSVTGIKLGATVEDQNRFAALIVGLVDIDELPDSGTATFFDFNRDIKQMQFGDFKDLMGRYKNYCLGIEVQF